MKISSLVLVLFLFIGTVYGFPVKNIQKGGRIDFSKFEALEKPFETSINAKNKKVMFLWDSRKKLSLDILKDFIKLCSEKNIICYPVEVKQLSKDEVLRLIGEPDKNVYVLSYKGDIIDDWGLFTLPVTVFLDESNSVMDAIGYEGQYLTKVSRLLDFYTGKITKEEYEKFQNVTEILRKRSILPDLNFAIKLIKSRQKEDALKKLEEIDKTNMNNHEKVKLAEVFIMLGKYKDAMEIVSPIINLDMNARFYMGVASFYAGDLQKAMDILSGMEGIYPKKQKIYLMLGKIYKSKQEYEKATEYFEKSCEKDIFD